MLAAILVVVVVVVVVIDTHWQPRFIMSVSLALGILNMAPIIMLDGEHALLVLIDMLLPTLTRTRKQQLYKAILYSTSALFVANIIVSVLVLMR
jgi:membrane-associated protease RseP (regulator of RpoE activity)